MCQNSLSPQHPSTASYLEQGLSVPQLQRRAKLDILDQSVRRLICKMINRSNDEGGGFKTCKIWNQATSPGEGLMRGGFEMRNQPPSQGLLRRPGSRYEIRPTSTTGTNRICANVIQWRVVLPSERTQVTFK